MRVRTAMYVLSVLALVGAVASVSSAQNAAARQPSSRVIVPGPKPNTATR